MTILQRQWLNRLLVQGAGTLLLGCALVAALIWAEFDLEVLMSSGPRFTEFFSRLVPPDWSVGTLVLKSTVETLMIAFAGTGLAVIVSLPLGLLAAANVTPAWVHTPVKTVLGFIRSIPLIVVAMVFVTAVGLGPFPGMLAIAFHSTGMLAKFYAEEFETAEHGIINAIVGTGASKIQTIRFGVLAQCVPQAVSFTLYRFEMNFRDATVLGLVGAGGIGYYISAYVRSFQYEKVAVLLIVISAVVFLLDQTTFWIRRWVR